MASVSYETLSISKAFLNADEIARDVSPSDVEAGRRTLFRRRALLERRHPFCVETTRATRTLLRFVHEAKRVGFRVKIVFLFTPSAYINEMRVKQRVMAGGHNVSIDTIRRRHALGLKYFTDYWQVCAEGIVRCMDACAVGDIA